MRRVAKAKKQERFTALLHHLSVDLLRDSFYLLKRQAAPGVDGVTWEECETGWRIGWPICTAVCIVERTGHNPRGESVSRRLTDAKRPLGVAALEDKIVQQAVVTILNQIYDVDFRGSA